jgi:hypothetical protein
VFTASRLSQHIKNEAVQIDCAPKPMFLTVDRDDDFVEMPFIDEPQRGRRTPRKTVF